MSSTIGLQAILQSYHPGVTIEYRAGRGWYIMYKTITMYGFDNKKLLRRYVENVIKRGYLYPPSASETYK